MRMKTFIVKYAVIVELGSLLGDVVTDCVAVLEVRSDYIANITVKIPDARSSIIHTNR